MGFEVFDKRQTALAKAPTVTIQRKGIISINRAAYSMMGEPSAVELLYDRERQIVGFRAAAETVGHAYEVRPQNSTKSTGPLIVAGTAFTNFYKIDTSISRRFEPYVQDDILCIDLAEGGVEIVGNRASRSQAAAQDDE